jgi:membrane protease YdiL (CAAX protease family)
MSHNFFHLKKAFGLTPTAQILIISILFSLMTLAGYQQYTTSGTMFGYPLAISLLFVPIYEELIFRGFILGELLNTYSERTSILISCLLFALWHIKNIFWLTPAQLLTQMLMAGLIFGPVTAYITIKKKTLWIGVILHYANNLLAGVNIAGIFMLLLNR